MSKVRAKRKHFNAYGASYAKNPGKIYDVPGADEAQRLVDDGLVEIVAGADADDDAGGQQPTSPGNGE